MSDEPEKVVASFTYGLAVLNPLPSDCRMIITSDAAEPWPAWMPNWLCSLIPTLVIIGLLLVQYLCLAGFFWCILVLARGHW